MQTMERNTSIKHINEMFEMAPAHCLSGIQKSILRMAKMLGRGTIGGVVLGRGG